MFFFFRRGGEKCRNNGGFLSISILFAVGFGPENGWHSVFFERKKCCNNGGFSGISILFAVF